MGGRDPLWLTSLISLGTGSRDEPQDGERCVISDPILGGTGTVGSEVVKALRGRGDPVRVVTGSSDELDEGLEAVEADMTGPLSFEEKFAGISAPPPSLRVEDRPGGRPSRSRASTTRSCARIRGEALGREVAYAGDDLDAWEERARAMLPAWMAYHFRLMYEVFIEEGLTPRGTSSTRPAPSSAASPAPPGTSPRKPPSSGRRRGPQVADLRLRNPPGRCRSADCCGSHLVPAGTRRTARAGTDRGG